MDEEFVYLLVICLIGMVCRSQDGQAALDVESGLRDLGIGEEAPVAVLFIFSPIAIKFVKNFIFKSKSNILVIKIS
ncbi:MAG: hypothetical protein J5I98_25940 [Phaeodactylibacter sp.]|nr:hypothetical protein [Phaeodactylibacter sp.]